MIDLGMAIVRAIAAGRPIRHPFEEDLSFLYRTVFDAPPAGGADRRNVCVSLRGRLIGAPREQVSAPGWRCSTLAARSVSAGR